MSAAVAGLLTDAGGIAPDCIFASESCASFFDPSSLAVASRSPTVTRPLSDPFTGGSAWQPMHLVCSTASTSHGSPAPAGGGGGLPASVPPDVPDEPPEVPDEPPDVPDEPPDVPDDPPEAPLDVPDEPDEPDEPDDVSGIPVAPELPVPDAPLDAPDHDPLEPS